MTHEDYLELQASHYRCVTGACPEEQQAYVAACLAGAEALRLVRKYLVIRDEPRHGTIAQAVDAANRENAVLGAMRALLATETPR